MNACLLSTDSGSPTYSQCKLRGTIFRPPYWCTPDVRQHGGSILSSVNFCEIFRRISAVWENAQTQNLEKCLLYLLPISNNLLTLFTEWFSIYFLLRDSENDL